MLKRDKVTARARLRDRFLGMAIMKISLALFVLLVVGVRLPAFGQSSGDILRHMADCEDDYKITNDSSAYLRCMADVQDEIDGLDSSSSVSPKEAAVFDAQVNFNACEYHAKSKSEMDKCVADYRRVVGGVPDSIDTATAQGKFYKCIYLAKTVDEVHKCSSDLQAASVPKPLPASNDNAQSLFITQVKENSAAGKTSPAANAAIAAGFTATSPQQAEQLIKEGAASRCLVVTSPPGATLFVDGKLAGRTPMAFYLFRHSDGPRVLTLKLDGYNTIEKHEAPDGKDISLILTLVPIN